MVVNHDTPTSLRGGGAAPTAAPATGLLDKYTAEIVKPIRPILGRENLVEAVGASLERPEVSNICLLGPAGSGKTALIGEVARLDPEREYVEIDLSRLVSDYGTTAVAGAIKQLFTEAIEAAKWGRHLVLFLDEAHVLVQLSAAAVEAVKPALAASGRLGLRVVMATTYEEFDQFMRPNQALVERLQRISVPPPTKDVTVDILLSTAAKWGERLGKDLALKIVETTDIYVPASSQPRKSLMVLDAMIGRARLARKTGQDAQLDHDALVDVMKVTSGVHIAHEVDPASIKQALDQVVFSQDFATSVVADRLALVATGLNDPTRPLSTLLLTGSTGVGKATTCSTMIPVFAEDGLAAWKRAGDVQAGDQVFARTGQPQKVLGVFPQGRRQVYRVTLGDGRFLDVSDNHLWAVHPAKHRFAKGVEQGYTIYSTQTLHRKGLRTPGRSGRPALKYFIPMNQAVQWPHRKLPLDPYTLGALLGDGCLTGNVIVLSSPDEDIAKAVAIGLGAAGYDKLSDANYDWVFRTGEHWGKRQWRRAQVRDVFTGSLAFLAGSNSFTKRIPDEYMIASVEQRWALVKGLFDTDGSISRDDRANVSFSSANATLINQVRTLLFSLGVSSTIRCYKRSNQSNAEYRLRVKAGREDRARFFEHSPKKQVAVKCASYSLKRVKHFDMVGIESVEPLDREEDMVCFYVEDDEHLYQAGEFVVTHNTELLKQVARVLYGQDAAEGPTSRLIRFDMSEYSQDSMVEVFRADLSSRAWAAGHGLIMLDEIEKAAPSCTRLLLAVLDDARITDAHGRQVAMSNFHIALTTNVASEIYQVIGTYDPDDTGGASVMDQRLDEIRRALAQTASEGRFPPELLGRLDVIVPFTPLSRATIRKIVEAKLGKLMNQVFDIYGVWLTATSDVVDFLVEDKGSVDSNAGGARAAVGMLTSLVTTALARWLIAKPPGAVTAQIAIEGVMASKDKTILTGDAHVVIKS
jgi:ATP-dependent Clp protease ATP-binding subunit ClpA